MPARTLQFASTTRRICCLCGDAVTRTLFFCCARPTYVGEGLRTCKSAMPLSTTPSEFRQLRDVPRHAVRRFKWVTYARHIDEKELAAKQNVRRKGDRK